VFNWQSQHRATHNPSTGSGTIFFSTEPCSLVQVRGEVMASLSLDTICNSATFFAGRWTPALRRNQSRDVLKLVLSKLYGANQGSLFHARMRCSHAALAASVGLSREWICTLVSRLRKAGWIETVAPRRADGKLQEITTFRVGRTLKRLLVMLLKSFQKRHHQQSPRVNDCSQKLPTKEDVVRNKAFLAELLASLSQKLAPPGARRAW
jgi:hypothetical protein